MTSLCAAEDAGLSSSSRLTVERLAHVITYNEFLTRYLMPNVPCMLPYALVQHWPAFHEWTDSDTAHDDCSQLHHSFEKLAELYRSHEVPVVIERRRSHDVEEDEMKEAERSQDTLANAIALMKRHKTDGAHTFVYIKDWHLIRQERLASSRNVQPYQTPSLFADDYMNNSILSSDDDFRFCYAGMQGTRTNIHRDVYTSYSWSTNVVGIKRWRLFPPHVKQHLRKLPDVATSELAESVDKMQALSAADQLGSVKDGKLGWPTWALAMQECHEVYQQPGETIFVPSDWHHEVTNMTDTISLNHNWCNSTNIVSMYRSICEEVSNVEEALSDVRQMLQEGSSSHNDEQGDKGVDWRYEWCAIVQRVAQANAGWAWYGFWTMIKHNLANPPCSPDLRPDHDFVQRQLQPCLSEFFARQEYIFLDENIKQTARSCLELLLKQT